MAVHESRVNLSYEELRALYDERASIVTSLREQVRNLAAERDEIRSGFDHLTVALRRSGCCDTHAPDAAQ